jgi:hypothetical protein
MGQKVEEFKFYNKGKLGVLRFGYIPCILHLATDGGGSIDRQTP